MCSATAGNPGRSRNCRANGWRKHWSRRFRSVAWDCSPTAGERRPPFPHDAAFAAAIRNYRQDLIEKYSKPAGEPPALDMCAWLRRNRDSLDHTGGVGVIEGPEILQIVAELEGDKACVEDLGAVNRWSARSGVPVEDYLRLWRASCAEIYAPGRLPTRLARSLCFS